MPKGEQEVEVKFLVRDLPALEARLIELGAALATPRVFETNLRFDTRERAFRTSGQALRLRYDTRAVLTYKGPARGEGGASSRQEIELQVDDFNAARRFLEALGYQVMVIYEKYRMTYRMDDVLVTLDEMPYGTFTEIEYAGEGDAFTAIHSAADALHLNWDARCISSYLGLFDQLKLNLRLSIKNLTFEGMKNVAVEPEDLNLEYADTGG